MPKRHRHSLRTKDAKKLFLEINKMLGIDIEQFFKKKLQVEIYETEVAEIFVFNGRPLLARSNEKLYPTLSFKELFPVLPKIVVDMGAIPYVCKGADVMAPGVLNIKGEFEESDILLVVDERHSKPLALGLALFNFEEMKTIKHGKILKTLHYVGDKLWDYLKEI